MSLMARLRSRLAGPPASDFYGLATRGRHVPAVELAIAEAALSGAGPLAGRFAAQLREAPDVWRLRADDGSYELRVSATDTVPGVPRSGYRSRPIPIRDEPSGRSLELVLFVSIAGVIELHGSALDRRAWPASVSIDGHRLDAIRRAAPWIDLPTRDELASGRARATASIEHWLRDPGGFSRWSASIAAGPPADDAALAAFELAQGFTLPPAYRELVLVANGIEIGSLVILGTDDAYRLALPGPGQLVISPPDEDGAFVLDASGNVRFLPSSATSTLDGSPVAADLRAWVRGLTGHG